VWKTGVAEYRLQSGVYGREKNPTKVGALNTGEIKTLRETGIFDF